MDVISSKKPDVPKKPEVKIEYNDRTYQSYIDTGFEDLLSPGSTNRTAHYVNSPRDRILAFLNEADIRKGPVERTVTSMFRLKAIDWNSPKRERKEFIWYEERWTAVNWLGIPLKNPIDGHVEGKYMEVVTTPKLDERTGEHIENTFAGTRESYYIPFTKKNVDEIIANSAHTDKFGIKYTVKFGHEDSPESMTGSTRNQFSYDMFLWSWDKLYEWQHWAVDEVAMRPRPNKSATNLEFKPS
jgi:hypothetical protein